MAAEQLQTHLAEPDGGFLLRTFMELHLQYDI